MPLAKNEPEKRLQVLQRMYSNTMIAEYIQFTGLLQALLKRLSKCLDDW